MQSAATEASAVAVFNEYGTDKDLPDLQRARQWLAALPGKFPA